MSLNNEGTKHIRAKAKVQAETQTPPRPLPPPRVAGSGLWLRDLRRFPLGRPGPGYLCAPPQNRKSSQFSPKSMLGICVVFLVRRPHWRHRPVFISAFPSMSEPTPVTAATFARVPGAGAPRSGTPSLLRRCGWKVVPVIPG